VQAWRRAGTPCAFTIDAGPNVHIICESANASAIKDKLLSITGVNQVLTSGVGGETVLI